MNDGATLLKKSRGVALDQVRALLHAFLLSDFFGVSSRQQAGSALAAGALFQAGLASAAGAILYLALPPFQLAVAGLTLVAVLTALVMGPEAGAVLRLSQDRLAGQPVSRGTARTAAAVHALLYIVLGTSGAAIPIAVFTGCAAGSALVGLLTYFAALHQTLFFAAVVAGLEALLGASRRLAPWRPMVAFLTGTMLVGILLLGIRPLPELRAAIDTNPGFLYIFPVAWFAAEAVAPAILTDPLLPMLALAGTAAAMVLGACAALLPAATSGFVASRNPLRNIFERFFVKSSEKATFHFMLDVLPREGDRALRAGPIFAFPAGLLVVGSAIRDAEERRLFVHVLLFVVNAFLPAAVLLLARSPHAAARWVFDLAPLDNPRALRSGMFKAGIVSIIIPLFTVLEGADIMLSGFATAALHAPLVFLAMLFVLDRAILQLPDPFPFGQPMERLEGGAGEGAMGLAFILTIVGFAEAWLVRSVPASVVATVVVGGAFYLKRKSGAK